MVEIQLKGPGKNALGTETMHQLREQLTAAKGEPVLLSGAGDAFSAGLNLKEVASLDEAGMAVFLERLEETFAALYFYPGPVVGLINGHAIAGGCVLAQCCDWRVAGDNPKVKIGLNEVALGLRFPPRTWEVVRRRIPVAHHEEVLLGAGLFDPRRALELGLLDAVAADPAAAARQELERRSALPRRAYLDAKRDLRGSTVEDLVPEAESKRRIREMLPVWTSAEVKARVMAVLAK
jgi:enoyl-CoA hydratase